MIELICFTDGGYDNNRKRNGYGSFKIFNGEEETLKRFRFDFIESSNEAEYETFIYLLHYLLENVPRDCNIKVFSDSQLLVNQVNKKWRVKSPNLKEFNETAVSLFDEFDNMSLTWVPRRLIVKQLGH